MLNMNSPIVQNLMKTGFNPCTNIGLNQIQQQEQYNYRNNQYINQYPMFNNYQYNPYCEPQPSNDILDNWNYSYDPMPKVVINEARGINSRIIEPANTYNNYNSLYNNQVFNGYMNPILTKNQYQNESIKQREEAIHQGKIWRTLLKGRAFESDDFNIDEAVETVESFYYQEPYKEDIPIKDKIVIDKNNHIAELESKLLYYRQNNIPILTEMDILRNRVCAYYNNINDIIGDIDNCDMVDYFTRVYPELKHRELDREVEKYNKNLKNRYKNDDFDKLVNKTTQDKPDSYYMKMMETFAETGVRFETSNGITITPDCMEVRLPDRLLKNRQDVYYDQRKKFFNAIFNKEGNNIG